MKIGDPKAVPIIQPIHAPSIGRISRSNIFDNSSVKKNPMVAGIPIMIGIKNPRINERIIELTPLYQRTK